MKQKHVLNLDIQVVPDIHSCDIIQHIVAFPMSVSKFTNQFPFSNDITFPLKPSLANLKEPRDYPQKDWRVLVMVQKCFLDGG